MSNLETDKLTQLHVNTMNINALVGQLKCIQEEHQRSITRIHNLDNIVSNLTVELQSLRQTVMIMKAMSMGHGSS